MKIMKFSEVNELMSYPFPIAALNLYLLHMILQRNADSSFHCVTLGMTGVSWVKGEGSSGEPINVSIQDEIFSGSPLLPS